MKNSYSLDLESTSSQFATATDHADFQFGAGDFTVMAWVKREANSGDFAIFGKTNADVEGIRLFFRSENTLRLDLRSSSAGDEILGGSTVTNTNWHHVAITRIGTAIKVYLDFVEDGSGTSSRNVSASGQNFFVGKYGSSQYFDGLIDEFRVYKGRGLTLAEIQSIAYKKKKTDTGLVAYWQLNNSYVDKTGNSHDLTPTGSPVFSTTVPFTKYKDAGGLLAVL